MLQHLSTGSLAVLGLRASTPTPDAEQAKAASEGFDPGQIIPASIILGVAIAVGLVLRYGLDRLIRSSNSIIARLVGRTAMFIAVAIGLVYALSSMGIRVGLLLGGLGIGGFAVAFALKDTLENLIAGVILQVRQPFDYDDLVQLGDFEGSVEDINLRSVEMTVFSGERVILPSSHVLHNPIVNLTVNGTRRVDIAVGVGYESDVDEAAAVVTDAMGNVEGVLDDPAPIATFDGFGPSSVDLTARYWIDADGDYFGIQRAVAAAIKRSLDDASIDMPFPHRQLVEPASSRREQQDEERPRRDDGRQRTDDERDADAREAVGADA